MTEPIMPSRPILYIDRRKHGLRVRDVFFAHQEEGVPRTGADLIYFMQSSSLGPGATQFHTSLIDLRQDSEGLFAEMSKGFRYEIRRAAEKDNLKVEVQTSPTPKVLAEFIVFYNIFAKSKGIATANQEKLSRLRDLGALQLAWVGAHDGPWMAVHAYIVDGLRARLYYSASTSAGMEASAQRQLIGRANKLLHWQCLLAFKCQGLCHYDMGGISLGQALKAIDDFKQQFGGKLITEYNRVEAVSWRGRSAMALLRLRNRLKHQPPSKVVGPA